MFLLIIALTDFGFSSLPSLGSIWIFWCVQLIYQFGNNFTYM